MAQSKSGSGEGFHLAIVDGAAQTAWRQSLEQRAIGAGHERLGAEGIEHGEKCCAAALVEMRGDFIEQQDGRLAPDLRDQAGLRENEPDQKRLLLAGGA